MSRPPTGKTSANCTLEICLIALGQSRGLSSKDRRAETRAARCQTTHMHTTVVHSQLNCFFPLLVKLEAQGGYGVKMSVDTSVGGGLETLISRSPHRSLISIASPSQNTLTQPLTSHTRDELPDFPVCQLMANASGALHCRCKLIGLIEAADALSRFPTIIPAAALTLERRVEADRIISRNAMDQPPPAYASAPMPTFFAVERLLLYRSSPHLRC